MKIEEIMGISNKIFMLGVGNVNCTMNVSYQRRSRGNRLVAKVIYYTPYDYEHHFQLSNANGGEVIYKGLMTLTGIIVELTDPMDLITIAKDIALQDNLESLVMNFKYRYDVGSYTLVYVKGTSLVFDRNKNKAYCFPHSNKMAHVMLCKILEKGIKVKFKEMSNKDLFATLGKLLLVAKKYKDLKPIVDNILGVIP